METGSYADLFHGMAQGICINELILDDARQPIDYRVVDVNPAYEAILHTPRSEVVGRRASALYGSDEAPFLEQYVKVVQGGERSSFQTFFPPADIFLEISAIPLGQNGFATVLSDITERRRAEAALRESEDKYRDLYNNAQVGLCRTRTSDGKIITCNDKYAEMAGYNSSEECIAEYLTAEHYVDPSLRARLGQDLRERGEIQHVEAEVTRRDGTSAWISFSARISADGETVDGVSYDITEQKLAQTALRESEEKYRGLFETVAVGVSISDLASGRVLELNPAMTEILGYSMPELQSTGLARALVDPDQPQKLFQALRRAGSVDGLELQFRHKSGRELSGLVACRMIGFQGKDAILTTVLDLTERKRVEREAARAQRIESLGILAGGIAHDFNNILTGVIGNLSLATYELGSSHPAVQLIKEAEQSSWRAKKLTDQLLTFSKGGTPIKKITSLSSVIEETTHFILRGSNVACEVDLPGDLWSINADEGQIGQVINNLVINAKQSMPEGGTVVISASNMEVPENTELPLKPGEHVLMSIQDQGTGIAREHMRKIFDPYFTTRTEGSGLGLTVCYSIVKKHGGHISVQSEPREGTTFKIYLPATSRSVAREQTAELEVPRGEGSIIVLEDDPNVYKVLDKMLTSMGYTCEFVVDGQSLVDLYRKKLSRDVKPDLLILDLTIPGKEGGEVALRRLLEVDPEVRAIVSSGYSNDPIMSRYKEYGFVGVIAKPYTVEGLSAVLVSALRK